MSGTNEEKKASDQLPAEQERILGIVAAVSEQALRERAMNNIVDKAEGEKERATRGGPCRDTNEEDDESFSEPNEGDGEEEMEAGPKTDTGEHKEEKVEEGASKEIL